jgi:hypothetical protein
MNKDKNSRIQATGTTGRRQINIRKIAKAAKANATARTTPTKTAPKATKIEFVTPDLVFQGDQLAFMEEFEHAVGAGGDNLSETERCEIAAAAAGITGGWWRTLKRSRMGLIKREGKEVRYNIGRITADGMNMDRQVVLVRRGYNPTGNPTPRSKRRK